MRRLCTRFFVRLLLHLHDDNPQLASRHVHLLIARTAGEQILLGF